MACLPWLDPDRLEYFLSSSGDILNVSIQKKNREKIIMCSHEKMLILRMQLTVVDRGSKIPDNPNVPDEGW